MHEKGFAMELTRKGLPRVVITGMGAVTSLGTVETLWENVKAGISGIRRVRSFDVSRLPVKVVGEVPDFDPRQYIEHKEARRMARSSQFAVGAAKMALADAELAEEQLVEETERIGVSVGTGLGGYEVLAEATHRYMTTTCKISPFALVSGLPNMPAHYVSRYAHATGPLSALSTACATGTQSIGSASDMIRLGQADIVLTGGVESVLTDYALVAFDAMTVLAQGFEDCPTEASRPFDADRCGFVYSEGCGILVLESLEHAQKRGARVYAEVLGHGESSDSNHVAALDTEGKGAVRAMKWALDDAEINPEDIDYINAHGTATVANDAIETLAIKKLFKHHAYKLAVSSTKSMLGHCMGASGAIEAIVCVKSLVNQVLHPTINYRRPDPKCDLDYIPNEARDKKLRRVLSNSFGLGGQNACVVLGSL
jgi:3-oxoacyl-[acyl-carrier-protein] synthase II